MNTFINLQFLFYVFGILQLKHHNSMRYNGCKFHIKKLNEKINTSDCGIIIVYQVTNVSSRSDTHCNDQQSYTQWKYSKYFEDKYIHCRIVIVNCILYKRIYVKWLQMRIRACLYTLGRCPFICGHVSKTCLFITN